MLIELALRQPRARAQRRVGKRLLGQPLAIVERAGDRDRRDVAAERRELRLLDGVTPPSGNSTTTRVPADAVKGLRDGAAGVAGGRDQHRQRRDRRR